MERCEKEDMEGCGGGGPLGGPGRWS
jgi:hypothetical protein